MAKTTLPKTGLNKQDLLDPDWTVVLEEGFTNLEARTGLNGVGPPGLLQGNWYGQTYFDRTAQEFYECVSLVSGANSWVRRSSVPTGQIGLFFRSTAPLGWIRFGAAYSKSSYPALAAILPPGITQTSTTFTLPNIDLMPIIFRDITLPNSLPFPNIGQIPMTNELDFTDGATKTPIAVFNVLAAVKF